MISTISSGRSHHLYGEMAADDTPKESPIREDLEHVLKAGRQGESHPADSHLHSHQRTSRATSQMEPVVKEGLKMLGQRFRQTLKSPGVYVPTGSRPG